MPVINYEGKNTHKVSARVDEDREVEVMTDVEVTVDGKKQTVQELQKITRRFSRHVNFVFIPGPNKVPSDVWDALKDGSDAVKRMLKSNKLAPIMVPGEEEDDDEVELEDMDDVDIGKMDAWNAEKLVEGTVHIHLLRKFKEQETSRRGGPRKGVGKKLEAQISAVEEADDDASKSKAR